MQKKLGEWFLAAVLVLTVSSVAMRLFGSCQVK